MNRLVALSYSPWSEKARWALLHHRIPFRETEYLPMLGTPFLRLATGRYSGRVTVPALLTDPPEETALMDSFDIAQFAERHGQGTPLMPAAALPAISEWNARSERIMEAGRALATRRTAQDPEAQAEALPDAIPAFLRRLSRPITAAGVEYFHRKYGAATGTEAERTEAIRNELVALRSGLAGGDTLLGTFSYADVAMAVALQFVQPVDGCRPIMKPATRRTFTQPGLATEFADLLAWRDAVFARHQPSA
jgi:glutathione S-transferase